MSDDPIGDALRADAEAARAEIRAAGLICPSCDVNMADLPDGHSLVMISRTPVSRDCGFGHPVALIGKPENSCECRDGLPVVLTDEDFGTWQAAANIALWDDFRRREAEAFKAIIGTGPANFTGLLSVLEQP